MNKTKTLRFYLTEICDEFHNEKDCYYRLKFAKETVGLFNSLVDVFLKIESLKTPVRLWVLRNKKFGSVISFPLAINFRSLSQEKKEQFIAKILADDPNFNLNESTQPNQKTSQPKNLTLDQSEHFDLQSLKSKTNKEKPKTEILITENEKTIEEILYALKQNNTDHPIECPVCDDENHLEELNSECPCHLVELEIIESVDDLEQKDDKNSSLVHLENSEISSQKTPESNLDLEDSETLEEFDQDQEDDLNSSEENEQNLAKISPNLVFNQDISDEFDNELLEKVDSVSQALIEKVSDHEFEDELLEKDSHSDHDQSEDQIYSLKTANNFAQEENHQIHSEYCDFSPKNSDSSHSCQTCGHNKSCSWCQRYRTYLFEAKNCPACLDKFKQKNFDYLEKISQLRLPSQKIVSFSKKEPKICKTCVHNALCPWCQRYRTYLNEAQNCPKCKALFEAKNISISQKIRELSHPSYPSYLLKNPYFSKCVACNHNATCPWCQKYRTYLLEAKNCPACLDKFKQQNFDIDAKLNLLRDNSYFSHLASLKSTVNCKACNHNATCPWCQKYRTYLLEAKNCPACLAKFKEQNFDLDAKINLLRSNSYYNNLANNIKCKACFHNASCQWCQKYATYLLEAKNCPACLAKFRTQNFDLEKKLKELRTNDLQKLTSLIWQQTYNSPCPACNHNFFCPKCRKLAAFYREARKCQACQLILKKKNIDIEQKIAELSFYPYYESRALLRYNLFESDALFNQNCSSCLHVYSCRFCQKYRTFLLEAKNCPACKYLFAKKGISIDYLLKVINFWNHPDSFNHVDPLSVLKHGRPIVHEKIVEIVDIPKIEIVEPPRIEIVEIPQIAEPPKIVEPVLDYSWVKIHPYYPQIGTFELNKFPAIIPLFRGIVYQAFLDLNRGDHSSIVDDELFNTKRGFGGYNVQSSGGLSVGLGDLSVDEATRVIAASTSSVDEDEEIIIVATEKSTIWGLPSYVLWFIVFALIAVILVVVIMFILYGAGII
ncbi:hypothetical protein [Mesomycoplasma ovipneumoniae]|uniref:IMCp domain-containing protein n=1 Tax=Mesomycoplasma ovipneumoniae TaxID=29562 RepID=UPI0030808DA9